MFAKRLYIPFFLFLVGLMLLLIVITVLMNDHDNITDDSGTPITSNFQLVNHLGKTVHP